LKKLDNEGGGYCAMWSLIVMDMILENPEMTTLNIIHEILKHSQQNPTYLSRLVRGYVVLLEKQIDDLIKLLRTLYNHVEGDVEDFKFRDVTVLKNGKHDKGKAFSAHNKIISKFFEREKPNISAWFLATRLELNNSSSSSSSPSPAPRTPTPVLNDSDYTDSDSDSE